MIDRAKILFVTKHWPLAAAYGAQQRVLNMGRLLSRFGQVSFVIVTLEPEDEETVRRTRREFEVCRVIRPAPIALGNLVHRLQRRLRHEFDPNYLETECAAVTDADRSALLELVRRHDIVWVHSVTTVNWCRIDRWPHSVLDVDDLPSRFYRLSAHSRGNPVRRLLDARSAWAWRRRERYHTQRFDVVTVCSEDDRQYLGNQSKMHVIPNGFARLATRFHVQSEQPRIGFIGLFKYGPNVEGVEWFIRDVWPLIKNEIPRVQLRLVGRGSNGCLSKLGPDVVELGWLEDPSDEIASWSTMIVPIKVGGGTRIKIAEGFARKCPVVSTSTGAVGYDVHDGEEILLADRPYEFALACIRLLRDPQLREHVSERAHRRFLEQWTWDSFESSVGRVIQECLSKSGCSQID